MKLKFAKTMSMILFAFVVLGSMQASAEGINWKTYEEGMAKAKAEGKKVYINFHADWCYYCKVMKQKTFTDKTLAAYLNEKFVAIRIDTEKEKKLARDFRVRGLPTNWFLEPDGSRIGMKAGYLTPTQLMDNLKFVYDEKYKTKK